MKPVVFWTDALVWIVVAIVVGYALHARKREHLAAPWRRVARSGAGMAAAVVLAAYASVGLLDSLHFYPAIESKDPKAKVTYAVEATSVLDVLLADVRQRTEKTYSAPFALHLFQRETVELPGGKIAREYVRLRHGGAHLADASGRTRDVAVRAVLGLAFAAVAWWLAVGLITATMRRGTGRRAGENWRAIWRGETETAWRAAFITLGVLFAIAFPTFMLATKYHVFGTDKVGQDVLVLALKSIRTALIIGGLTTIVSMPFAVLLGISAGYFKGWVDDAITYVYTTLSSIPGVLLIAAFVLMLQVFLDQHPEWFRTTAERADLRLLGLCVILGVTSWIGLARLLRGETLKLREMEYIQAAHAFGVGHARVIRRHILPNVMHLVLISLVMEFSGLVLAEAVLSYIGVGVDPTMTSFGTMINTARLEMSREPMVWWALAAAFVFMFVLVLAANLFADAVRDAFDPRTTVGRAMVRA